MAKEVNYKIDAAITHYQRGWKLWQQSDCLEQQEKLLGNIAFCYYLKAFKNRDISHSDWQETRRSLGEKDMGFDGVRSHSLKKTTQMPIR